MEDEDDIFENQPEFLAERNVWARVGGPDIGLGLGGMINLKKSGYTIGEKFKLIAAATIKMLNDGMEEDLLSDAALTRMLSLVESDKMPDFQTKNPSAFAMGYVVAIHSNYNTLEIDREKLEVIFKLNNELESSFFSRIEERDILRYVRFCLIHKLK
ncbi:hypothetical protein MIV072L [Invertebrate iridescent virus 3]|uniref:Uncharacterized protein 072L n=1 Tax=Invertebrate iridescent virus 3 TaxID=345201 RepID=072L_IIV3|nr:hypothetical protein MIV072L [Invertebrate iridescent virus 3]Q196Y8.1 RecName: Full=Uncharacterized protein 072L [Invertebrate iridescent virus 3]ABF82102.1 hypothetical protein MIV072L [Invertebrate iridescent virus 3]